MFRPEYAINKERLSQLKYFFSDISISTGLESSDNYIRNKLLNKGTHLNTYRRMVRACSELNIECEAYVQLGKPFLSAKEDVEDAVRSINFAFDVGFHNIILMVMNLQPFTLTDFLHKQGLYDLPELWRPIEVISRLPSEYRKRVYVKGFDRAFPMPLELAKNCFICTEEVQKALINFNFSGDFDKFLAPLDCNCKKNFEEKMQLSENAIPKSKLTLQNIVNSTNVQRICHR